MQDSEEKTRENKERLSVLLALLTKIIKLVFQLNFVICLISL